MAAPTRTRIAADERRHQILAATHRVTLERGLHDVRVADVADELDVSTGLIHYHFATKDELIEAMLRETADRRGGRPSGRPGRASPRRRSAWTRRSRRTCRRCGGDPSWVLWIDVWGEALRDANVRRISEELDAAWVELIAEVIADGVAAGVFRCDDPVASSWRLCALLDGLGLQVVLHQSTMTRAQMHKHVRRAASLELGYDLPTDPADAPSARARRGPSGQIGSGRRAVASVRPIKPVARRRPLVHPSGWVMGTDPRQPRCTPHAVAVVVLALTASHHESKRKEVCIEMDNPRSEKVAIVDEIASKLSDSKAVFVTEYRGLKVGALATLRGALRESGAEHKVYKNTLARFAADKAGLEGLKELLVGPDRADVRR